MELLPFANIKFSKLLSPVFGDVDLKFGILICLDVLQIKIHFWRVWLIAHQLFHSATI